ncbi:MAG TPA: pyridoxamine 5'-phosphate oxidase family protein [Acidimicrobiales bacterium]|nr:pyridoxamine 5'-phosphate oxidase family protein [Acidimicrobiales bacterium]
MSIRLTTDEAWDVLERAHTGILTTLRRDGSPITLPIWFVALDRTICFSAPSRTKKVARLRHDPRASFLVESGSRWAELCAVHLSGSVEVVEDDADRARINEALDAKYAAFRTARGNMPDATQQYYTGRTFFRLVPGPRVLTWDNSRIELKEGA